MKQLWAVSIFSALLAFYFISYPNPYLVKSKSCDYSLNCHEKCPPPPDGADFFGYISHCHSEATCTTQD